MNADAKVLWTSLDDIVSLESALDISINKNFMVHSGLHVFHAVDHAFIPKVGFL